MRPEIVLDGVLLISVLRRIRDYGAICVRQLNIYAAPESRGMRYFKLCAYMPTHGKYLEKHMTSTLIFVYHTVH